MEYAVRNAETRDLETIQKIYAYARSFMARSGNPNQWRNSHPPLSQLQEDVARGELYVLTADGEIHGVFFFRLGEDPTYAVIDGAWRSQTPYGTIHRIAGDGSGGILAAATAFAKGQTNHLRIDTHADNHVMQKALAKQGFQQRGVIFLENGEPRIAYDLLTEGE